MFHGQSDSGTSQRLKAPATPCYAQPRHGGPAKDCGRDAEQLSSWLVPNPRRFLSRRRDKTSRPSYVGHTSLSGLGSCW